MKLDRIDTYFLERCNQLANIADSRIYPNPRVGSVIVHEGSIIGEGFHKMPGEGHGEVIAVASVKDKNLLSSSCLYVNLEPCNHFGKTPPCTNLILKNKIPRVVIGSLDPNPQVAGAGVERLRKQGVEVILAEYPKPFVALNKVFFVNQLYKRAFFVLKWAESADNFMARYSKEGKAIPTPISGSQSLGLAHKLRAQHQAILVGKNTAAIDNPRLNTRLFPGRTPLRIILDRNLSLSKSLRIFQDGLPSLILNDHINEKQGSVRYYIPDQFTDLKKLGEEMYQNLGICSVLVEGGAQILQQFIDQEAFDEIWRVEARKKLYSGVKGPKISKGFIFEYKKLDREDLLFINKGAEYLKLLDNYYR